MKKPALAVYVWLALAGCATPVVDDGTPATEKLTPEEQLASLTFLEGNWAGPSPKGVWEAHYTSPAGNTVLGMSKEQQPDGKVFSSLEMIAMHEGKVVFWPYPYGERAGGFALVECDRENRIAAFENEANNFPQRYEFWRVDDDTLVIKLSSLQKVNDKFPGIILKLTRSRP